MPVVYQGRLKPFDTLARNLLMKISDSETFRGPDGKRQPAIRWLLDSIAKPQTAAQHQVFRIYNLDVLQMLGLEPRPGFFRYSLDEIRGTGDQAGKGLAEFDRQVEQAHQAGTKNLDYFQRKLLETSDRFNTYMLLVRTFQPLDFSAALDAEEAQGDPDARREADPQTVGRGDRGRQHAAADGSPAVRAVSGGEAGGKAWAAYATVCNKAF